MRDPIDFVRLASALLDRADTMVPGWLPGGRRNGAEWECADLSGGKGTSLRVNLHTGKWADFATDDKGGDLISLYAAIHNIDNGTAARQLMELLGWAAPESRQSTTAHRAQPAPASSRGQGAADERPAPPAEDDDKAKARTTWTPIVPVPESAPAPDMSHWQRGLPEASWLYMVDGQLWGAVARYPTSDGGKDIVPWTWCQDKGDSRGLMKWHMKQWEEPRPLYLPGGVKPSADAPRIIVVVEGEKCALALHQLLEGFKPDVYTVVSWPGGGKAWDKASWDWLAPAFGLVPIVLWPDCDAKHHKLTKAERDAGVDVKTKPLLPADKQPGMVTMMGIAQHLQGLGCCPEALAVCQIPAPGAVADGWDVADAIAQGWTAEQVETFILNAPTLDVIGSDQPLHHAGAGQDEGEARGRGKRDKGGWRDWLLTTDKGAIKACRENIVLALDGVPAKDVPGIPAAAGIIAFNEFTNNVVKLKDTPWGTKAGEWLEEDELEMGAWLVREHFLPSMPRTGLEEAVKMVAGRHRFHPVRQYLDTLRGKWDGQRRLNRWLKDVCRAQVPVGIDPDLNDKYLARVGSWLVMAMVARVMRPGCKYDYMVIFEGKQGLGKSTLARALGGDWFADTGLVMGEKDAYQNLQGVWVYEIGELDSMSKAEVTKVKAFVSSEKDRFRASFDRRPRDYPRQVVFVGTTNEDHYLTDLTGNRRFWPVRVGGQIDIAWLKEHRDQLFAEALHFLEQGHRYHPTSDEQRELFDPQQLARTVEPPIESRIVAYLYDENLNAGHGQLQGYLRNEITTSELLSAIGVGIEKQVGADRLIKQAAAILKKLGWREGKSSAKGGAKRVQVYKRPVTESATAQVQSHEDERATEDVPF